MRAIERRNSWVPLAEADGGKLSLQPSGSALHPALSVQLWVERTRDGQAPQPIPGAEVAA